MTPGQSRAFFAAFSLLTLAFAVNALRQPERAASAALSTAASVDGAKGTAPTRLRTEAKAAVPTDGVVAAVGLREGSSRPATSAGASMGAREPAPAGPSIMLSRVTAPVRVEGRLPSAAVVGQLPLPSALDGPRPVVSSIQKALIEAGYGPQIVNGTAGPLTRAAIMAFEHEHRLPLTGEANEALLARLSGGRAPAATPAPDARQIATQEAEHVVLIVQSWLQSLGYQGVRSDGRVGEETAAAIRAFEMDIGAEPKGRISAALFGALAQRVGARSSQQGAASVE